MKAVCGIAAVLIILSSVCGQARATEDEGYFLSLRQKGQLIGRGQIEDAHGTWYDVRIVPGYRYPVRFGWRNIKAAGTDLREYVEAEKYADIWDHGGDCIEWAFDDCLAEFAMEGAVDAWGKYFGRANRRVGKRVFGWWMAYPWALMQSVADNVVRVPLGLCGTVAGTAAGTVIVPAFHMTDSGVKAAWNGGIEGLLLPASGIAWNTAVSPPLALLGQRPAKERVDGFWVRIVPAGSEPGKEPDAAQLAALVRWGRILSEAMGPYERQRAAAREKLQARLDVLRKEMQSINQQLYNEVHAVTKREKEHLQGLSAAPEHRDTVEAIRRGCWSQASVRRHRETIRSLLREDAGLSRQEATKIIGLLERYPPIETMPPGTDDPLEKTDPVAESIHVIKQID